MDVNAFNVMSMLLTFAVIIGYINHRFVKMQTTIAMMFAALLLSLGLIAFDVLFGYSKAERAVAGLLSQIDFHDVLMNGLLSFLLFAGGLSIDIDHLKAHKWEIATLAIPGTLISTFLIGTVIFYALPYFDFQVKYVYCLLFGALISPTDPIAVLAIFRKVGAPRKLEMIVAGESLFNDGVAIVLFLTLYDLAFSGGELSLENALKLFFQEALGGMVYGVALGMFSYWIMKPIKDIKFDLLVSLAIATGGYVFAQKMHISGPLAMVMAGIFLGNRGSEFSLSRQAQQGLQEFWELIDEVLNAMLFILIGLEILMLKLSDLELIVSLLTIPLVLLVRWIIVGVPMSIFKRWNRYPPYTISIMVWGGLRGGLAVALALALPSDIERHVILTMTYAVVAFAIIVQGLTINPLVGQTKIGR